MGERVVAVVQPTDPTAPPTVADLDAHCRASLAGYKVPRGVARRRRGSQDAAGKPDYAWAKTEAQLVTS